MDVCMRCMVSGKVQGVFYRASARHEAERLGLRGYARNLTDGRVEVLLCGSPDAVNQMRSWLVKGPAGARVTSVACEAVPEQFVPGFSIS
jgi:acylphosphatase